MSSNKAAFLAKAGGPLSVEDTPFPKPGPDDIIVKNHAVAINPVDVYQYSTGSFVQNFPTVLGQDVAGEVYEVGSSVTKFKKGDRVVGHVWSLQTGKTQDGAFALYSNISSKNAAPLPSSIPFKNGAVLPLAIDTAVAGLFHPDGLALPWPQEGTAKPTGKTIVVYGASSSVGSMAVQLAHAAGVKVIGIASKHNADLVKEAGADQFLDYHDSDVVEAALKSIDASSFAGVYDAIGNEASHKIIVPIFEKLGGSSRYTTVSGTPDNLPKGVTNQNLFGLGEHTLPIWKSFVGNALASGQLKCLPRADVVGKGLDSVQAAVEAIGKGVSGKKLVVEL